MALSDSQKKLLTYGVPVVVVLFVIAYLRSRSSSSAPTGTTAAAGPNNSAIGVDQLASFESGVESQIQAIATQLSAPPPAVAGATTVAPPVNPVPAPPAPTLATGQLSIGGQVYNHIPGPTAGNVLYASGASIYAVEAGTPVLVAQNDQTLPAFAKLPAGSALYIKAP